MIIILDVHVKYTVPQEKKATCIDQCITVQTA